MSLVPFGIEAREGLAKYLEMSGPDTEAESSGSLAKCLDPPEQ